MLQHEVDALEEVDVAEDVALHGDDVGVLALADGIEALRHFSDIGAAFSAANGFRLASEPSSYSAEFIERYKAAQRARVA